MGTHSLLFFYIDNKLCVIIDKCFDSTISGIGNTIIEIVKYLESIENKVEYLRNVIAHKEYFSLVEDLNTFDFDYDTSYAYHIMINNNKTVIKVNQQGYETNLNCNFENANAIYGVYYTLEQFEHLVEMFKN